MIVPMDSLEFTVKLLFRVKVNRVRIQEFVVILKICRGTLVSAQRDSLVEIASFLWACEYLEIRK